MTSTTAPAPASVHVLVATPAAGYWILRLGAAFCFIGHGAFGFITKAAWLPYFGVIGIPEAWAWEMMPWIGAVDVLAGMAVLFAPTRLPLLYMVVWAAWTALLRPLAGESAFETLERAGNYGVPLALMLLGGVPRRLRDLCLPVVPGPVRPGGGRRVFEVLRWTVVLLLAGHGALGALGQKALLVEHYAAVGLPSSTVVVVGWIEIVLAAVIAARPAVGLLVFAAVWKVATESLFIVAGAPVWEFVERAGSYAAPLALAVFVVAGRSGLRGTTRDTERTRPLPVS